MTSTDTLTLAPETAAPAITPAASSIVPMASPDRATLAVETQRQPGGTLDPDSWIVPTGERLTTFLKNEPDQARVDQFAYEWMQDGMNAQSKGQGGGIAEEYKNGLRVYRDFRKARGEEPFQFLPAARTRAEDKAAREQVPFFRTLFSDPAKMAEAFPEDQRQAFEDRFTGALDPIAEKRKTAGVLLVSTMLNRPAEEVADLWPAYRAKYAADHLGISGPVDDAAFYQAAGKAFEQETKDDETARTIAQQAQAAAIQGRPLSYAIEQGKAATGEAWKKFAPAARAGYASILSEFNDSEIKHGRALFEAVADMEGKPVEDIAKGDGARAAWVVALEAYGNADQAGRDRIMNLIGLQAQSEGQDLTNYFKRLGAAFGSGVDMLTQGAGTLSARGQVAEFERIAAAETDPKLKAEVLARIPYLKGKASFAQDIATAGIRVSRYIDQKREGFWDSMGDFTVMAAESIPTMAAAALPMGAGLPIVAASYAERDLATLRREAPNTDEATLAATAYASGALEAGIDRLQFVTLGARLPKLNAKLMQLGKPGAVAVAAARVATVTAAETVQEVGQDLTRPAVQEIAAALSQDIPGPNWGKVLSDEADALGDIAGVSLIFGIIGGAGSTVMDYMQDPKIAEALKDRDGLALAGFSPETVENVATLAEENPAAAAETLKAAMMETPKEERQANAESARARIEQDTAPTAEEAGIPTMTKEADGRIAVNFPDAPAILADSPESALDAVREWEQGQEMDTTKAVREYLDFLTDYHASNPKATFTGKQTTSAPTLETWAGNNKERIAQANARVDILMRQAGTEMGIERPLLSEVPILGTSRNVRAGALTRMVAEIHKGGNPLTVIEEAAEAVGKWIMADSKVSESKLLGWIRTTEKQTGTKILSDELATMTPEARAQELAEGFSQIAKANAVGRIQDSALPSAVKSFFRAFKEAIASALRIAADFARLRTEGKVDPEFSYWLDVAAGLEPEFQMENLTRQMEADMLAESMAGFTEIQDALKGKIPHPDTLQAAGDPLAGDVRRLHDGMMNNPENGANKAARTRKTNEFFLPKGTAGNLDELRRSLNEQGFDFQTPSEMIEAADLSINYGRKQYGTADTAPADTNPDDWQQTFSVGLKSFSDSEYLAAVNRGDMETAQRMVDDAAKAAGYEAETFIHETTSKEAFTEFKVGGPKIRPGQELTMGDIWGGEKLSGHAIWFRPENGRSLSAHRKGDKKQIPVKLKLRMPLMEDREGIDAYGGFSKDFPQVVQPSDVARLKELGRDSVVYMDNGEIKEILVFDPTQIKSAAPVTHDADGKVIPLSKRFNPSDNRITFSIALRTDPLLAAIEASIKSPEKKAEIYQKMKARVAAVKRRFEDRRLRGEFDTEAGNIDKARFEQIRDIATLEAIGKALPPELRGKIVGSFRKLADLKTAKGRQAYMEKLLPRIERALEASLRRHYRAAIRRQIKKAAFSVAESRTRGGKIGAIGHAVFEQAKAAIKLTDDPATLIDGKTAADKAEEIAAKLRETLEGSPDLTDEQIEELDQRIAAVELFGAYGDADSARLEEALAFLNGTYMEGRKEWLATLAARRDVRFARVSTVETAMGREEGKPVTDAERTTAKRRGESLLRKFDEAVMQAALSGSQKIRRLAELSRSPAIMALTDEMEMAFLEAENQEADANATDNQALAAAMRRIFGTSTEYGTAKKLRELTTATGPAPVEKIEGRKKETVTIPLKYVENILAGELDAIEAGGERFADDVKAFDDYDLTQLEMAWEAFNDLPEDQQAKKRTLSFERTVAAGDRVTIGPVNQLEGLQLYLTMKQPDQFEKLDRLGYDEETLAQLEEWLRPEVKALGAWMVDHIGAEAFTLDSIHRAEKGVGLKLVENYFPVRNDVSAADNTGLSIDGNATRHTGRSIGAIKERVANSAPPAYVNALAVFLANRAQVNFWKSHVATLREWGGVIRDERFAAAVKIGIGETYYQALDTMLRRIESGGALNAAKLMDWERMVKNLTSSFAVGTLGGRVSTLAVNVAAGLNAGLEIPAADLAAGIAEVFARPEAFKDAFNSPAIQRRLAQGSSYEAQLAKASGPSKAPTIAQLNAWAQKGVEPINWVDTGANVIGAAVVWEHTRKESLRAGMTEDEARTEADNKVSRLLLRAAQPTTRLAKSELELKAAENPLAALFTLFTSEPRKTLAILYMAAREVTTGKGTYGKPMAAQQLFVAAVIFQTADFLIRSAYAALAKAKDDEPENAIDRLRARIFDAKAWGYTLTTTHLRSVPIAGEVWSQAWAKALDQKAFAGSQNPLNRATREILTFKKPETIGEAVDGGIGILQGVGPVIPGGALFAQGGNVAEFMAGVSQSNGLDFSDEDRAKRIKARFNAYKATLETIHGKTQQPTGKTGKDGKPKTKADEKIQAAKWAAMADRLRADLAPASPEIRALVLESITAPEEVKKRITKELKSAPAAP